MTNDRAGLRPAAHFSTAGGPPTEESRGFFQQRLALFAKIAFILSTGFFLFSAAASTFQPGSMPPSAGADSGLETVTSTRTVNRVPPSCSAKMTVFSVSNSTLPSASVRLTELKTSRSGGTTS